jgi:O-antigen/teichoic acid export membrane protein
MNVSWINTRYEYLRILFKGTGSLHSAARNAGWLLSERILRVLTALFVGTWVARYLGPAQFGEFAYAIAFTAFFQTLACLGLDGVVVRDLARNKQHAPVILGTVFRMRIISGILAWCFALLLVAILRPGDKRVLLLVALTAGGIVFQAADTVDLWFQSQSQSKRTVKAKLMAMLVANSAKVFLIIMNVSVIAFAAVQLLEIVLGAVALGLAYRGFPLQIRWSGARSVARELFRDSWPLLLGGLSIVIYMRINQIILSELAGTQELGIYSAVVPFTDSWSFIPAVLCTSLAPVIARKKQSGENAYYNALQYIFTFMTWGAICLAAVLAILSPVIVNLLLGGSYSASASILAIQVWALIPTFLGVAQGLWVINEGKGRFLLFQTTLGAAVSVGMSFLLVPYYGAIGAAISYVSAQFAAVVGANIMLERRIFKMQVRGLLLRFDYR